MIPGFASAQAAHDASEPGDPDDNDDECTCRRRDCDDCGIGPDDARDYDDD